MTYKKDADRMAKAASKCVLAEVLRFNDAMSSNEEDPGSAETLASSARFLEACKDEITRLIDGKIAMIKERMV